MPQLPLCPCDAKLCVAASAFRMCLCIIGSASLSIEKFIFKLSNSLRAAQLHPCVVSPLCDGRMQVLSLCAPVLFRIRVVGVGAFATVGS